jgi:haloacetate dehalogenase
VKQTASAFLDGFALRRVQANGIAINFAIAGQGPPLLLLHGHPQTHVTWRKVAPQFVAAGYQVIAPDLRGYGDSEKPVSDAEHMPYSKREMAKDQIALMHSLGHNRFSIVAHDRGARVAHRLALDHPGAVERMVLVDIAPTATMYAQTNKEFATRYFWWFFLIQPEDLPERMIGSDPEHFLRGHLGRQIQSDTVLEEAVFAEYLRSYRNPETIHAICEDYRAAAGIDLVHDAADAERRISAPVLALWGQKGVVGQLYDVIETWREKALDVQGAALPCGHAVQEEVPNVFVGRVLAFLAR